MDPRVTALIERLQVAALETEKLQSSLADRVAQALKVDNLDQARSTVKELGADLGRQLKSHSATIREASSIADEIGQGQGEPTTAIGPDAIVDQFRTMIDSVHEDVRMGRDGETAATLRSVDVEVKGLIVIDGDRAQIVPPHPDRPIDPGQLSTIRMSFGAIPVARPAVAREPGDDQPPPAGPRRTARRRRPS